MVANRWQAGALTLGLALASSATAFAADQIKFGMLRVPNAMLIGLETGYFAAEGIAAEVVFFRSGAEVASQLAAGHIDVGATTAGATLYNAMARGVPTKIVGDYIVYVEKPAVNAVVVRKDLFDSGQITKAADLKGRTIAITARGQFTHLLAGKALESAGLTVDDAKLVTMSYPDMLAAFAGGSIDAAELVPGMNLAVLMYGQRLLERERELGERFMRAFHRANTTKRELAATPQGRDEIAAVYQKYVPRQDGSIYARVPQPLGREDLLVNVHGPNGLADQLAWYVKQGLVPEVPDLDRSVVDNSFAEKAKKAGM
jgi:NitT/TauT family transport system substrate-binding protein